MNGKILACAAGLSAAAFTGCVEEDNDIIVNINNPVPDTVYVPYSNTDSLYRIISEQTDSLNAERAENQKRRKEQQARNDSVLAVLANSSSQEDHGVPQESYYSLEQEKTYQWAYEKGITVAPTIEKFSGYQRVSRENFFGALNKFLEKTLHKDPYKWSGENSEGVMTKAEAYTVISRGLWGNKFDSKGGGTPYWSLHGAALRELGVIPDFDQNDLNGTLSLFDFVRILQRIDEKRGLLEEKNADK